MPSLGTRVLAAELAGTGILGNAVSPGWVWPTSVARTHHEASSKALIQPSDCRRCPMVGLPVVSSTNASRWNGKAGCLDRCSQPCLTWENDNGDIGFA